MPGFQESKTVSVGKISKKFELKNPWPLKIAGPPTEIERPRAGPPTRGTLVSVSIYERNFSPETSITQIHQDMGCQQGIVLSEKPRSK